MKRANSSKTPGNIRQARKLRERQTPHEHELWQQLRAKRFSGYKFRRQQPLGRFVVDFVCFSKKLILEIDGGQHAEAAEHDAQRDALLKQGGYRILRFWNNEWTEQQDAVLETIWLALQETTPLPNPSPARGEGLECGTRVQCASATDGTRSSFRESDADVVTRFSLCGSDAEASRSSVPNLSSPLTEVTPKLPSPLAGEGSGERGKSITTNSITDNPVKNDGNDPFRF